MAIYHHMCFGNFNCSDYMLYCSLPQIERPISWEDISLTSNSDSNKQKETNKFEISPPTFFLNTAALKSDSKKETPTFPRKHF